MKSSFKFFEFSLGDGLGKNNDGINKPLKAAYKFNKSGLGHNAADELNNHWWENVFNAAASNVDVNEGEDGVVSMERKSGESVEVNKLLRCSDLRNLTSLSF